MEEVDDEVVSQCRIFIDNFNTEPIDEDYLEFRKAPKLITDDDLNAEILDWVFGYLKTVNCPLSLSAAVARNVQLDFKSVNLEDLLCDRDAKANALGYDQARLWKVVANKMRETVQRLSQIPDHELRALVPSSSRELSVCAIKNGRRDMEDRHVIIPDVNALFGIVDDGEPTSFYAVFDGHAGVEAACYASVHLHYNVMNHPSYPDDIETALKEGFKKTDVNFIEKCNREGLKSGSTALCCLLQGRKLYVAWLGDSQAILVREGNPVSVMIPHKPNHQDEKDRIENLGGIVVHFGTWRVNGTLAVSRAIGDAEYKPYVSGDPDVVALDMDGTEDFVVLACDGLWDVLQPNDVAALVYSHIVEDVDDVNSVAAKLIQVAKIKGSSDNITVIIVFLRDVKDIHASIPFYKKASEVGVIGNLPLNGNPFFIGDSPTEDSKLEFAHHESEEVIQTQKADFDQSQPFMPSEISGFVDGTGDHVQTPKVFADFASDWDESGFKCQQQHFLERESQMETNPFYESNLKTFTAAGSAEENFFGYMSERTVVEGSSVTDWPDKEERGGQELVDLTSSQAFDGIKPFQSNLSPDAKPFVMPDSVSAAVEHGLYFESTTIRTKSTNVAEPLITDPYCYDGESALPYSYPVSTLPSEETFVHDVTKKYTDNPFEGGFTSHETEGLKNSQAAPQPVEHKQLVEETWQEALPANKKVQSPTSPPEDTVFHRETVTEMEKSSSLELLPEKSAIDTDVLVDTNPEIGTTQTLMDEVLFSDIGLEKTDSPHLFKTENLESLGEDVKTLSLEDDFAELKIATPETENVLSGNGTSSFVFASEKSGNLADFEIEDRNKIVDCFSEIKTDEFSQSYIGAVDNLEELRTDDNNGGDGDLAGIAQTADIPAAIESEEIHEKIDDLVLSDEAIVPSCNNEEPVVENLLDVGQIAHENVATPIEESFAQSKYEIEDSYVPMDSAKEFAVPNERVEDQGANVYQQQSTDDQLEYFERPDVGSEVEQDNETTRNKQQSLTYVETIISDVKFDHSADILSQPVAEQPRGVQKNEETKSDVPPLSAFDAELKEPQVLASAATDNVLVAEGVEDDESEDGEEWKFYRTEGTELKSATSLTTDVRVEDTPKDIKDDEPLLSSSSILDSNVSLGESDIRPLDSSPEAHVPLQEDLVAEKPAKVENSSVVVAAAPATEIEVQKPKPKEPAKPKSSTATKGVASRPSAPLPSKSSASTKRTTTSGTSATQKTVTASSKTVSKSADLIKKTQVKPIAGRSAAVVSSSSGKVNGESAKNEVEPKKSAPLSRPKPPVPKLDHSKVQVRGTATSTLKTTTISGTAASATTTTTTTTVTAKRGTTTSVKTSKEQVNVRSKVAPGSAVATNGQGKVTKTKTTPLIIEKKTTVTVTSTGTRPVTKTSSGLKDSIKTAGSTTAHKVDAKQLKETVNKQISGTTRKVGTATTKASLPKQELNGNRASPKSTPSTVASNGVTPEKKTTPITHRSAPQTSTPKSKTSTPRPAVGSTKLTITSTTTSSLRTSTTASSRMTSTPTSTPRSAKSSPLVSKGRTPPVKSSSKTPTGGSKVDSRTKLVDNAKGAKNGLTSGKVEDGTNEKGILDAASRESAVLGAVVVDVVTTDVSNGVEKEHQIESPQEVGDQLVNGQTVESSQQTEETAVLV